MSDDWAVGDLAVCVDAATHDGSGVAPKLLAEGRTYRVTQVWEMVSWISGRRVPGLAIDGPMNPHAQFGRWPAYRFRKIRPDAHEGSADDWQLISETTKRKVKA